jgi:DNA-binding FadR family transcriptional regulator
MMIDGKLYREAYELMRQWNEAELKARTTRVDRRTPAERWQQYRSLWNFCAQLSSPRSQMSLRRHYEDWAHYYSQMQRFEAWRNENTTRT